ncbi:hypothetical protein DMN91_002136 [Ooceraea biroi]|uniref:Tektin n=1 Tax=Ooceraea biroi TaxID=2015173 RepID=A0A3L8E0G0_OOCBI|nr:hypothetical protein DMN91_002136 [Ooceraea biroi]
MEQIADPSIPTKIGEFYKTPRPHPWRPTIGYELVEATPLETDEKVQEGQLESGRKLGEKITFWRNEVALELEKLITESNKMQECRRGLQTAIQNFEGQLHIAQECLYHRESRKGIDLVHDEVEYALLKEIETIKNCQKKLEQFIDKCVAQLTNNRAIQHQLQVNIQDKETALGVCHQLNNFSRGLQCYAGVEKYYCSVIGAESWVEASNAAIRKSQAERAKSCRLRDDVGSAVKTVGCEVLEIWDDTTKALERRVVEMLDAKGKLQIHLRKIQQEIFGIEKSMEPIRKTIAGKSSALKVARTRLEARTHRPEAESCNDHAQLRMSEEVKDINKIARDTSMKLQRFEAQHQQLLHTRSNLESDLKSKIDALFIDREKCMGLRRSYPISSNVKF